MSLIIAKLDCFIKQIFLFFQYGQHQSSQRMVARPPRLVRARVHDLPPEQAHHVVIVGRVVVRSVVKNVDGVSGLGVDDVINDVVVVTDVGGSADVSGHR